MNPCAREIEWAGGKHVFCLNAPPVLAVLSRDRTAPRMARTRTGVIDLDPLDGGPAACLKRFDEGGYTIPDIERVILYGLWGGGMGIPAADALVAEHVRGKPLAPSAQVAFEVIAALFVGEQQNAVASA